MSLGGPVKLLAGSANSLTKAHSASGNDDADYFELVNLDLSLIPPIHKGWVKKKQPRNKNKLQKRWLALYEDRLHYCREEGGPPLGVIGLQYVRAEIYQGHRNMFEVCFDDMHRRRYQFVTTPDVDRAVWVWKINCCSYLKYGTTRKHLTIYTVSYLKETMGIDKVKKMLTSMSCTAASDHFLYGAGEEDDCLERAVGTEPLPPPDRRALRKEDSMDSEVSTSSEERWRINSRLSEAESTSQYINIPPCVESEGYSVYTGVGGAEESNYEEELYFCPKTGKESRDLGEDHLISEITDIRKREKQVFVPSDLGVTKGNFTHEEKEEEPDYLLHTDIGGIFETLESLNQKAEAMEEDAYKAINHYTTLEELDEAIPPVPLRQRGSGIDFLTNAIKTAWDGKRKSDAEIVEAYSVATQCGSGVTDDVIKVRIAGVNDFIEVELNDIGTTFISLLDCFAEEFGLDSEDIMMVRKLPDVWIRPCEKDVKRIAAKQEFEIELRK